MSVRNIVVCIILVAAVLAGLFFFILPELKVKRILSGYQAGRTYGNVTIDYPRDGTIFPPDISPPVFSWHSDESNVDTWLITFRFSDNGKHKEFITSSQKWEPTRKQWEKVMTLCVEKPAIFSVIGVKGSNPDVILCSKSISIKVSCDPVGAPIFYRDVNLPFGQAIKDPSRICWRFGHVSSLQQPPVVLQGLPVCGNCHSFSLDGKTLGMDIDYANDKGSYVTAPVASEIELTKKRIITWSDYRKDDGGQTFGLLSQVSPDGRYVVSTVKDRSVFVATSDLEFSQLFFPIQGILAVYDRQTGEYKSLPGADDAEFVQSNPVWSPDGRSIVFARSRVYRLRNLSRRDNVLLTQEECVEFQKEGKLFLYDLYRIPFNNGKGGVAEPVKGASNNGRSNFFPKYSPDGKWIVFCMARSFMLLQPDSELFIIPSEGGDARRLECNTSRMNSWHSWSPNSRWLVFSSKAGTPYTRLFLSHIDEKGMSSPAVLLSKFTSPDRAANIPEFVNLKSEGIRKICENFIDDVSFFRAGNAFREGGQMDNAIAQYRKALELNPDNVETLVNLATLLSNTNMIQEAVTCLQKAVRIAPTNATVLYNLAVTVARQGDLDAAIRCCRESVKFDPQSANARSNLGIFLMERGGLDEAAVHLNEAIRLDPDKGNTHFALGRILVRKGRLAEAVKHYSEAVRLSPDEALYFNALAWVLATAPDVNLRDGKRAVELATRLCKLSGAESPRPLDILGASYAEAGQFPEAVEAATSAFNLAVKQGNQKLAADINKRLDLYRQNKAFHQ